MRNYKHYIKREKESKVFAIVSLVVLQEAMTPLQILGGLLILGFTLWNEKE